jgi:periplasmic divalent cation tolerance protein
LAAIAIPRHPSPMPTLIVHCTCPDTQTAERIATALIERRLAACVNILPGVTSVYRWQGAVEQAGEVLLMIKTEAARYPALQAAIVELHPYELPEVVAVEAAAGLPAYLDWVRDATSVTG